MENVKEFKELIHKYESITIKDIFNSKKIRPSTKFNSRGCLNKLTGFGEFSTCILCKKVNKDVFRNGCSQCVYKSYTGCVSASYRKIKLADTPRKLLYAVHQRARVLRRYARMQGIEID